MIKETLNIQTKNKISMICITKDIISFVKKYNITNGKVHIFVPHTTAAVTINENCDPDVQIDLCEAMKKLFPDNLNIHHCEGNSSAHLMSSLVGAGLDIYITDGEPLLGTWQGIYFWEFDGPRTRKCYILYENP